MSSDNTGRAIVAAVDGSESARHAARWAAEEATRRHLPLRIVHAVRILPMVYTGGLVASQGFIDDANKLGKDAVATIRAEIADTHPDLDVRTDVVIADPIPTLITESENAAMVVLGSRGLGGFNSAMLVREFR